MVGAGRPLDGYLRFTLWFTSGAKNEMPNTKVERDFIFLMYASTEARKAIQKFEEMIELSQKKTMGVSTQPLGLEAAGRIISFENDGSVVALEHESVFASIRLGLHFAANASRVFWPASSWDKQRKKRAEERAKRLMTLCGMPASHAIKTRKARDRFEHLDEWLDDWTDPSPRPYLFVEGILQPNYPAQTREQILEGSCVVYDANTRSVILFGESFGLADMIHDLRDLQTYIQRGTTEIMKGWK